MVQYVKVFFAKNMCPLHVIIAPNRPPHELFRSCLIQYLYTNVFSFFFLLPLLAIFPFFLQGTLIRCFGGIFLEFINHKNPWVLALYVSLCCSSLASRIISFKLGHISNFCRTYLFFYRLSFGTWSLICPSLPPSLCSANITGMCWAPLGFYR